MSEITAKERSLEQEKRIARLFGGETTPRSGAGAWKKGDILTGGEDGWLVECKTTVAPAKSFSVQKSVLDKADKERAQMRKQNLALAFTLGDNFDDYFVLDKRVMSSILSQHEALKLLLSQQKQELVIINTRMHQMEEQAGMVPVTPQDRALYAAHKTRIESFIGYLEKLI